MRLFPIRVVLGRILLYAAIVVWRVIGSLAAGSLFGRLKENMTKNVQSIGLKRMKAIDCGRRCQPD